MQEKTWMLSSTKIYSGLSVILGGVEHEKVYEEHEEIL